MNAVTFPTRVHSVSLQSEAREKALGLRDLRYFLSVAQTGNVGRAARDLNVSQPAISLQLRKLEEGLGAQLLLRHGRGVTLTAAGACLRDRLDTVMRLLDSPLDDTAAEPMPRSLSFAVPAEAGAALITPLARAFRARWPDMTLDLREAGGADLEEWLLHRHVDLAMLPDKPSLPEIEATPVLTEALGLVAPVHSHIAAGAGSLALRELARDSLIVPGPRHWIRRRLDAAAQQHGVQLNPVLQVDSIALTKVLIQSGLGHGLLPRSCVQSEIERGALSFRLVGQPALYCTRTIAFHRAASNTAVSAFAAMACDVVTALAAEGAWPQAQIISSASTAVQLPVADASWRAAEEIVFR